MDGKKEEFRDMGIGTSANTKQRILNADGTFNVNRIGVPLLASYNFYNFLITVSWRKFIAIICIAYLLINSLFAWIYVWIGIDQLAGIVKGSDWDNLLEAFFFSVLKQLQLSDTDELVL